MTIFDAAMRYQEEGVPLVVLAGKEYGSGSSRDWAAKGPRLLGVRAVIARELRAHPPLEPRRHGHPAAPVRRRARALRASGLTGDETFDVADVADGAVADHAVTAQHRTEGDAGRRSRSRCGSTRPQEWLYYKHGGILQFVLRQLLRAGTSAEAR